MKIQRYYENNDDVCYVGCRLDEGPNGDWVKATDVEALEARCAELIILAKNTVNLIELGLSPVACDKLMEGIARAEGEAEG